MMMPQYQRQHALPHTSYLMSARPETPREHAMVAGGRARRAVAPCSPESPYSVSDAGIIAKCNITNNGQCVKAKEIVSRESGYNLDKTKGNAERANFGTRTTTPVFKASGNCT